MKKFLAMLLVAAMVFSMAACAKAPEAAQPAATEETAGETAETAEAPKDGKVYKVAMICDSSISDGGWGMSCYNAMMDAAEKHGWKPPYPTALNSPHTLTLSIPTALWATI